MVKNSVSFILYRVSYMQSFRIDLLLHVIKESAEEEVLQKIKFLEVYYV